MKNFCQNLSAWLGGKKASDSLPALGSREIDVLKLVWQQGELSAQEMVLYFSEEQLSLSTMQSTLERLHRKKLLKRHKVGRAYVYTAAVSQSDIVSRLMDDIAQHLGNGNSEVMISGFMSYIENQGDDATHQSMKTRFKKDSGTQK
ncbi:BlaI/MecI/CopY family transcriptional regulator [Alteromonas confluentis]|uniref:Uncharacterized protein n=1 Tax=Alteromonas confluentis TaxID=1656094 RepID=A0A1E7ZA18_9ALTE|nr:BlaI/MecI/CopY family transcriptional regulator [Alteromonas confluentis]OFC70375.1 hypothetical protein BFC18_14500 [Alteromonas confluentis]